MQKNTKFIRKGFFLPRVLITHQLNQHAHLSAHTAQRPSTRERAERAARCGIQERAHSSRLRTKRGGPLRATVFLFPQSEKVPTPPRSYAPGGEMSPPTPTTAPGSTCHDGEVRDEGRADAQVRHARAFTCIGSETASSHHIPVRKFSSSQSRYPRVERFAMERRGDPPRRRAARHLNRRLPELRSRRLAPFSAPEAWGGRGRGASGSKTW